MSIDAILWATRTQKPFACASIYQAQGCGILTAQEWTVMSELSAVWRACTRAAVTSAAAKLFNVDIYVREIRGLQRHIEPYRLAENSP